MLGEVHKSIDKSGYKLEKCPNCIWELIIDTDNFG